MGRDPPKENSGTVPLKRPHIPWEKLQFLSTFSVSACIMLANLPLVKTSHMENPRLSEEGTTHGNEYQELRFICSHIWDSMLLTKNNKISAEILFLQLFFWDHVQLVSSQIWPFSYITTPHIDFHTYSTFKSLLLHIRPWHLAFVLWGWNDRIPFSRITFRLMMYHYSNLQESLYHPSYPLGLLKSPP